MNRGQTRVCRLTASGRGAVAVVAIDGPLATVVVNRYFRAANGRSLEDQPLKRIVYGCWGTATGEDLIVCRRAAQEIEIHCHGGAQSSAQIVSDLVSADCTEIDWQDWVADRHECPLSATAQIALAHARTARTAAVLLDQYDGALRREMDAIREGLADGRAGAASDRLEQLLAWADLGLHLTEPWRVVIAGEPNVGKSSLINSLVGYQRAIVFDQPGTTRDVVTATTAIDGWPVSLSDTAGLHEATDPIESTGIAMAVEQLHRADLVVWVLDATELATGDRVQSRLRAVAPSVDWSRVLMVANKIDLVGEAIDLGDATLATCAVSGAGVDQLVETIACRLVPVAPPRGAAVPFTAGQVDRLRKSHEACIAGEFDRAARLLAFQAL